MSIDQCATISRIIYVIIDILETKIQVGFVQINDKYVSVWRPYDPNDKGHEAKWRNGIWKNVYSSRMYWKAESGKVRMIVEPQKFGDLEIFLPRADNDLTGALKGYLGAVLT